MKMCFPFIFAIVFIAAFILTSCNQNGPAKETAAASAQNLDSGMVTKVNIDDSIFAANALSGSMLEIEMGKLCADHAKNTGVKNFGAMMITDHTQASNELIAIASRKNLQMPAMMNDRDQNMYDSLKHKTGSDFDKTYINMMVIGHEDVLMAFRKEANEGKDADISSFAAKTVPTIQKHLDAAKEAQKAI